MLSLIRNPLRKALVNTAAIANRNYSVVNQETEAEFDNKWQSYFKKLNLNLFI